MLLKDNNEWKKIEAAFIKVNGVWITLTKSALETALSTNICYDAGKTDDSGILTILGPSLIYGETSQYTLAKNGIALPPAEVSWNIISGAAYATINNSGALTILPGADSSPVTIGATYGTRMQEKELTLTYMNGVTADTTTSSETIHTEDGVIEKTTTTTEITDASGNTTVIENVVEIITNNNGETTYVESNTMENPDGSSTSNYTSTDFDESGNTIGSTESQTTTNADGSMTGQTTNYNADGEPTNSTNVSGDTAGNVNTQSLEYDESGNSVVNGYTIDTSGNPDGGKSYNGDGVNTEYYAFDVTRGFVLDYHFTIDCSNKPAGQDENHHNALTAKRASPSPWYGFQIRQSTTNKYVQLGTQFATGSNTNTKINPAGLTGNTAEYNLRIIYNPTASTNTFVCYDMANDTVVYRSNNIFPDIEDLKYIKVTIGYALDENGDPFRYSNIDVKNFSIRRLTSVEAPAIDCDGEHVTITCATAGAAIYYRLNEFGSFHKYTAPVAITADTVVEAYAETNEDRSATVKETCIFDNGVEAPVISCDGEIVTITCEATGQTIYYRLNESGNYALYESPFTITATTVVEAYAELDSKRSKIVTENCIYNPEHDYSLDYLTFKIISGGTIVWNSLGTGSAKSIQYSVNGGAWTTIGASSASTISVSDGDDVRFKGTNTSYATSNENYSGFEGGTAIFDIEGNIMSLVYGENFIGNTGLTGSYNFCSLFKKANAISAENLILPATTLTPHCYRALFANNPLLTTPPQLPATTLANSCYRFMFQECSITTAPDLLAQNLVTECYYGMFNKCGNLNYIRCLAKNNSALNVTSYWTELVARSGTFIKDINTSWAVGENGIPTSWVVVEEGIAKPDVVCDGLNITLSCRTAGATIYYKLNEDVNFVQYSIPIAITADTVIQTYSEFSGETSDVVTETCVYDDGIEEPVIYCDGVFVTISCETGGASIYYRLNQEGAYTLYGDAIAITADTVVQAYAEIDGRQSEIVTENCVYDDSLKAPVISCDGVNVTMECHTPDADIYYRLGQEGTFSLYESAITITADTYVYAYSELSGETSETVSEYCIYDPTHDYSQDYLTFNVLTDGTIVWNSIGSGQSKTIQYKVNDGGWTTISASSASSISVVTGDVVRFKGTNTSYAKDKSNYSGFEGGTAMVNVEGNIMSLVYGDNFVGNTGLTGTYNFCSLLKKLKVVSAENLVLPSTTLTNYCYRAMFSWCTDLIKAPELPATGLSQGCYWYMFEQCAITKAPTLPATELVRECYGNMFIDCASLNYVKCLATTGLSTYQCTQTWLQRVSATGTFVKDDNTTWSRGTSAVPTGWTIINADEEILAEPLVFCDGEEITITCDTPGAEIYYNATQARSYTLYTEPIPISADTIVTAYSKKGEMQTEPITETCVYNPETPFEKANKTLDSWVYNGQTVSTPYSVNRIDGHSASYAKGSFNFDKAVSLKAAQPTYLWFQHADQSATIYVDDNLVEKHWGGYNAFFVDITNFAHKGINNIRVAVKNNEGNNLAPASGDFNFNATLGNVKLYTSPVLPAMNYGYDGFHVTSTVADSAATVYVKTTVPSGGTVVCTIDDGTYHYSDTGNSVGNELTFTANIQNPHLWNGKLDPHLYNITIEIYYEGELYHRFQRPYGLRYYSYVINDTTVLPNNEPYTGFLLNGSPYLLRGVCMHDDIDGKANALSDADYTQTFSIIQELGCNFLRLAHYPHPKEVYDRCDQLGIIVQTEVPCVNKMQSTMPDDYYNHLNGQYDDMVNQHYNHPCIMFWGLSNETTTDDKVFANGKINGYISRIRALDSERMIGYVMAQGASDPSAYYNNPNADWFGSNIYEGWYTNKDSNNPTSAINTRVKNIITNKGKALAYSEYGCGGTQHCHSDDFMTTTTRGNYERHDIEYMMWLHEGHIAAIKNYPQLLFTAQWQLFDIAVANRNEGYTVCLDGETTSIEDSLRRLNDKGLVERDHITKKDPFYLYKAWWNTTDKFVHICGKDYTKKVDRVIKCYTNDDNNGEISLYVNGTFIENATVTDNIAAFTARTFNAGDVVRVDSANSSDTFTF